MTFAFMLCADDYALSPGVSRGILEALAAGRINATSAMTNQPGWPLAARELGAFSATADLGLHLTLTLGPPLTGAAALTPGGAPPSLARLARATLSGGIGYSALRAEIAAQLDAFCDALGRAPTHVDGHQHAHLLPVVRRALLDELAGRGWAGSVLLRDSGDAANRIFTRRVEMRKALVLAAMSLRFRAAADARGFTTNDGFSGFSSFRPEGDYARDFASYLKAPGQLQLVMCHPGHADAALAALDPVTTSRETELAFLLSDRFRDICEAAGATLARWPRQ